ncbi:hypothetical protein VR45_28250, partial [Streptomyces sp. NRRL S-495]
MSSIEQFQVTFDCAEPERLARFWCEALGYVVPPPPEGFATWEDSPARSPSPRGPRSRRRLRPVRTQVIVLNGGSSSGKTTLARALQNLLPDPWLAFSVDTL